MEVIVIILICLSLLWFLIPKRRKASPLLPIPEEYKQLLLHHVSFYKTLSTAKRLRFEQKMMLFLKNVRITGVKIKVEEIDKVLIGAGAIIPIFGFDNWEYTNISEVLLYPDNTNEEFVLEGSNRNIAGMVGNGPMQNTMIISQKYVREGFENMSDGGNTAIHEFVHLVDKSDGATDGLPENLISKKYVLPWLQLMHKKIAEIKEGRSDINAYGATNEAEFFAVASEYFFEQPQKLQEAHPQLYDLLEQIFKQSPSKKTSEKG